MSAHLRPGNMWSGKPRARLSWICAHCAIAFNACDSGKPFSFTEVDAPRIALHIIAGDRQRGVPGDTLFPIVAQVTDLAGIPQRGVEVLWKVGDSGAIAPTAQTTDENGLVEARWQLGELDEHEGVARVRNGPEGAFTAAEPPGRTLDLLEVGLLRPRTYEGSRETVHPDFVRTPENWGAYSQHLALTPYPNGQSAMENPSVYVSRSGYRWFPQAGLTNPVVTAGNEGYLSDPDLVYVPNLREMWMYYRKVDSKNHVMLVRSTNGAEWGEPIEVVSAPNHLVVSPAVVRRDDRTWLMFSVNGGALGCSDPSSGAELRRSSDGIRWGKPVPLDVHNDGPLTPWHMDVQWIESQKQYWMLYPAKFPKTCATRALFLATSPDGIKWTMYPTPVLKAGELPELMDIVYRSTFEYDEATDEIRFWFSGANLIDTLFNWRTISQRQARSPLFAKIALPSSMLMNRALNRTLPVMLNPP